MSMMKKQQNSNNQSLELEKRIINLEAQYQTINKILKQVEENDIKQQEEIDGLIIETKVNERKINMLEGYNNKEKYYFIFYSICIGIIILIILKEV